MDAREREIQKLCVQVTNMRPEVWYNSGGADESTCPLCRATVKYSDAEIEEIPHKLDCGYLIAKDLSTNITPKQ